MLWLCTFAVACAGDAGETIAATVRDFVGVTSMGIDGVNKQKIFCRQNQNLVANSFE